MQRELLDWSGNGAAVHCQGRRCFVAIPLNQTLSGSANRDITMDAATFAQQLAKTIAWCEPRVDLADRKWCLRSDSLRPEYDYRSPDDPTLLNDAKTINSVVQRRHAIVRSERRATASSTALHGGRVLMCYFDETNQDYGSAEESLWFYDGYDNPPWDTWVACLDGALVTWVPPQFLNLADDGMAVECCQMLMWLENPRSYILDDHPRQIPEWLKQYSWDIPSTKDAR